ncbi:hypothetical protein PI26_gp150 [Shigella phage Shf125875]|uniref:Uncharacterized protein n=1 Tax=Shigella phage Shf125875 TaxID=1541825 RepID=A0A088FW24_9CAUD|nr:hypothetical protein PI26_gp150 [Shigella phage Shf125875]AIM50841.1 hypothetical protein [Shigella phage Shf125875]
MIKKILAGAFGLLLLFTIRYYGVMFGLIQVVLFISDVIIVIRSLIW